MLKAGQDTLYIAYILAQRKKSEKSKAAAGLITASRKKRDTIGGGMMAARASRARLFPVFIPNTSRPSYQRAVLPWSYRHYRRRMDTRRKGKGNGCARELRRQRALKSTRLIIVLHNIACSHIYAMIPFRKRPDPCICRIFTGNA